MNGNLYYFSHISYNFKVQLNVSIDFLKFPFNDNDLNNSIYILI